MNEPTEISTEAKEAARQCAYTHSVERDAEIIQSACVAYHARATAAERETIEELKTIMDNLRRWLQEGSTIQATDPSMPVLEFRSDGTVCGNLTITGAIGFPAHGPIREML